ncbi:MAG TPA: hypothetical protein VF092_05280 [Longimicrobium sp.]
MRDYAAKLQEAEEGMAAKSAEFRAKGGEVYLPVVDSAGTAGAEREEAVAAD